MDIGESSVPFILSHLYPRVSTLKKVIQELTSASTGSISLDTDTPAYLTTCNRTLVAWERQNQLQEFSCSVRESSHRYSTRRKHLDKKKPLQTLESILTAARRVSEKGCLRRATSVHGQGTDCPQCMFRATL